MRHQLTDAHCHLATGGAAQDLSDHLRGHPGVHPGRCVRMGTAVVQILSTWQISFFQTLMVDKRPGC